MFEGSLVFVTSAEHSGKIPGIETADAICESAATDAGYGGTFIAWLSNGLANAHDRVTSNGPWYLVDESTLVFEDRAQLAVGAAQPIYLTEHGDDVGIALVWTGTRTDGTSSAAHCEAWTDDTLDGPGIHPVSGLTGSTDDAAAWTQLNTISCINQAHLYCLEL